MELNRPADAREQFLQTMLALCEVRRRWFLPATMCAARRRLYREDLGRLGSRNWSCCRRCVVLLLVARIGAIRSRTAPMANLVRISSLKVLLDANYVGKFIFR
jgi:hypothetical protein